MTGHDVLLVRQNLATHVRIAVFVQLQFLSVYLFSAPETDSPSHGTVQRIPLEKEVGFIVA